MKKSLADQRTTRSFFPLADAVFLLACALYAWLALNGVLVLSANGLDLDGDLQTYAQGMTRAAHPESFVLDPVLNRPTPANEIPNLQRWLGAALAPGEAWGAGLLRAGALAIFVFYAGWYFLGRYLFRLPAFAALLSILCGVTVWVGWGTFWGVTHSDPVPRVFFAALFPFLLILFYAGLKRPVLRPPALLLAGLAIWTHGVSALNCGAMFFLAYACLKPENYPWKRHFYNCCLCLAAFFLPVCVFLWPSLTQRSDFSPRDLETFRELFDLRWRKDYSDFWPRLARFFSPASQIFPLALAAIPAWFVGRLKGAPKIRELCASIPPFCVALALVALFCRFESVYAYNIGRPPMGHELIRGLKFLVPFAWLLIVAAFSTIAGKRSRRLALCAVIILVALFNVDRQYEAAQLFVSRQTGLILPLVAEAETRASKAAAHREALLALNEIVPENELVYGDDMGVRYFARRPLVHSFKDGYAHFYNKDVKGAEKWLYFESALKEGASGEKRVLRETGVKWLLLSPEASKNDELDAKTVWSKNGWKILETPLDDSRVPR